MTSTVVIMVVGVLATLALGRAAQLRVLVPSWRFFDRAAPPPALWVARDRGPWLLVAAPRRGGLGWLFAPASNLALAYQACVDRLASEIEEVDPEIADDDPAITELPSYALVTAIAREGLVPGTPFRWKIVCDGDDVVTSRESTA